MQFGSHVTIEGYIDIGDGSMKEKQEKTQATGAGAAHVFSLSVFILSFGWMIYAIFTVDNFVLSAIFAFLEDSSGFLTFLCIVIITMSLRRSQKQYHIAVLNAVNIVLLNRLYMNSQWWALYESVKNFLVGLNWANIFFFGALFVVAGYCIYVEWKQHRKYSGKKLGFESQQTSGDTASVEQGTGPQNSGSEAETLNPAPEHTPGAQSTPPSDPSGPNDPTRTTSLGQSNIRSATSVSSILLVTCFAVIVAYIGKMLVFDVWNLTSPTESLNAIFNILPILAILSASAIFALAIFKIIQSVKKTFRYNTFRATALLAILLEFGIILAVVLNGGNEFPDFLDGFLDGVVRYSLIALPLILVAMFIILDIFISVILKITFGTSSRDWI